MSPQHTPPATVASADGTAIAVYRSGAGPAVVIVDCALSTSADTAKLARLLSEHFTVIGFDRRGRAESPSDAAPTLEQEVADIAAVVATAGEPVVLFGHSSGAALALEAAVRLGAGAVRGLYLWEPPYIVDDSRAPVADDLPARVAAEVAAGHRSRAVALFYREALGIPGFGVAIMRLLPSWRRGTAIAHTLPGDFATVVGLQQGRPLPTDRWAGLTVPAVAVAGGKSEPFFATTVKALAALLPTVEAVVMPATHHGTPIMAPAPIVADLHTRFGS